MYSIPLTAIGQLLQTNTELQILIDGNDSLATGCTSICKYFKIE